ncbi:hypothetical protein WDU94_015463 [Cyamophila willieti]
MLARIDSLGNPKNVLKNVVYDYDVLHRTSTPVVSLSNDDVSRLGVEEHGKSKVLRFESRFESGNLRKAVQTGPHEYDLILMPDVNSNRHHQWYYFEVSNMDSNASYIFNIINLEKHQSQYEHGMMPLMFSVLESENGHGCWMRAGSDIFYYRNNYVRKRHELYKARVHPGESNASWLMDGIIRFLTENTPSAAKLRKTYVIKIVPMLNVEGVVNGCHRCCLSNEDLNRKWKSPHPVLHPEIFHTKGMIAFCADVLKRPPYLYCDFHGHSAKKNIFLYGCSGQESYLSKDKDLIQNDSEFSTLSRLLEQYSLIFDQESSNCKIQRNKESTARITMWREFGVTRSYTMESTYCGFDTGRFKGTQININHLMDMGASVCTALSAL